MEIKNEVVADTGTHTSDEKILYKALDDFANDITKFSEYLKQLPLNHVHNEWASWLFKPVDKKTFRQLLAHRESYKTTLMSMAIARHLIYFPDTRIAVVRSNKEEGKLFLRTVNTIMQSAEYLYLVVTLGYIKNSDELLTVDNADSLVLSYRRGNFKEGSVDAIGYEQNAIGRHYDIIVFDDFVTIQDRLSRAVREKKYVYANEFVHNILTDKGLAINLGTFWHKDDSNQLFKKAYINDDGLDFEEKIYPLGTVIKKTPAEIAKFKDSKIKGLGASLYYANYELKNYVDTDLPFNDVKEKEYIYEGVPHASIDTGFGGNYTAVSIGYEYKGEYMIIGKVFSNPVYEIYEVVASLLNAYKVTTAYVEGNADKGATCRKLQEISNTNMVDYTATKNKQWRIRSNILPSWDSIFFDVEKSDMEYINEVAQWNDYATHDDAPDSLAKLIEVIKENDGVAPPHLWG